MKNLLLLTVDCLKYDFLTISKGGLGTCPVIQRCAEEGVLWTQAHSHSTPTQISFPAIFSSTLPLDHGGYDLGVTPRPRTLAEELKQAGLRTIGFSTSPWLGRLFGYERGFDEFHELFDIDKVWKIFATIYHPFYCSLLANGAITRERFIQVEVSLLDRFLLGLIALCESLRSTLESGAVPYHQNMHRYALDVLADLVRAEHSRFAADREAYAASFHSRGVDADLLRMMTGRAELSTFRLYGIKVADRLLRTLGGQLWRPCYSVPATYLAEALSRAIMQNGKRPFFIWTHFLDIHEGTYISGSWGMPPGNLRYRRRVSRLKDNAARKRNLYSLRFIDEQIGVLFETLKTEGLLDTTLIVISGDHGIWDDCPDKRAGSLFEEATRVPVIFWHPGITRLRLDTVCGLIDLAPSILQIMGKTLPRGFRGRALGPDRRDNGPVILESLGPGPGDLQLKPIKIAVLKDGYKLIWREAGFEKAAPPERNYLFHLSSDPQERRNLHDDGKCAVVLRELQAIAEARASEIRCTIAMGGTSVGTTEE